MDLAASAGAGLGSVEVQNLSAGATEFSPVPGLQAVPLGLNPTANDASNPTLWNAVWLHFEGATYGLDNIEVGRGHAGTVQYGTGCGQPALGLRRVSRPVIGTVASMETFAIPAGSTAGLVLFGFTPIDPGIDLTTIGMPGCSLLVVVDASIPFTPAGATSRHALPLPNTPALVGVHLHLQSAAVVPGANRLGVLASNGLTWTLGSR